MQFYRVRNIFAFTAFNISKPLKKTFAKRAAAKQKRLRILIFGKIKLFKILTKNSQKE